MNHESPLYFSSSLSVLKPDLQNRIQYDIDVLPIFLRINDPSNDPDLEVVVQSCRRKLDESEHNSELYSMLGQNKYRREYASESLVRLIPPFVSQPH